MPSGFWDYIHLGRSSTTNNINDDDQAHNLQEGLFQIATQTCNILVQVNTNNINLGSNFNFKDFEASQGSAFGESSRSRDVATKKALFDLEQSVVLLQAKSGKIPTTPTKVRFSRLSEYKRRLSVSNNLCPAFLWTFLMQFSYYIRTFLFFELSITLFIYSQGQIVQNESCSVY